MADGTVDTSIYPKAQQNNLVEMLGQVQALKNAQATNKLLQLQEQTGQVGLNQVKIDQAHQMFGRLSNFLGSLAQDPRISTPQGHDILVGATQQAIKQGWITPEIAKVEIENMPSDPAQLPQYLQNLNTRVLEGQQKFGEIYGTPTMINNGSQQVPATVSPITGVRQIGAPIQTTLSPSERADLVPTVNGQGQTVLQPKANILTQAGMNPMTAVPQTAPSSPANRLIVPTLEEVQSPSPQNAPSGPAQPTGGGVVASPPAGQIEAQTRTAAAGADQYAQDTARERNFQSDIVPLQKAREALVRLGTTGTGPGTEQINEVKSFLVSQGIINPDQNIKDFDEARKYLTQFARSAGDTGTNDKLAAAFAGNPNVGISNAASVDVLKTAMSLRRMQNAQVRAFESSGQSPAGYGQWATKFNATQDPVAYGIDLMSPAERAKYYKGLSEPDKSKFIDSLNTATGLGLITPPSSGTAQNGN
jgi:hypothetical protein